MKKLIIPFLFIPLTEIVIYILLGRYIGLVPTLILVLGTGIAGVILLKQQGLYIVTAIRTELEYGRVPGNQLIEGLLILTGALLLITPGLLTDITGFILLFPQTRKWIREFVKGILRKWIKEGKVNMYFRFR